MADNAFRERMIDEYGTSAIWLGGIPLIDYLCNKGIKKYGFNPNINMNKYQISEDSKFTKKEPKKIKNPKKRIPH